MFFCIIVNPSSKFCTMSNPTVYFTYLFGALADNGNFVFELRALRLYIIAYYTSFTSIEVGYGNPQESLMMRRKNHVPSYPIFR